MKILIVSPEYMLQNGVCGSFKEDVRKRKGILKILPSSNFETGDIKAEGNEDGCGYWWVSIPKMGVIVDESLLNVPEELFEIE